MRAALAPGILLVATLLSGGDPLEPSWQVVAQVDDDESDDHIVAPPEVIEGCHAWLDAANIDYKPSRIRVHENKSGITCGAPQVVRYRRGPTGIRWKNSPQVTCKMALGMARLETIIQDEAQRHFGHRVVRIEHLGTYNCREMAAFPGWVSEHSYANGIDLRRFVLKTGRVIEVKGHYGDGVSPTNDPQTLFVRAVAQRAFDERVFSVVVTRAFDRLHHNHVHVDMARYRVDGTR